MKIAILSDIHGNFIALKEVLKQIEKNDINRLFVLGDQLGYYYQAEEVYRSLESYNCDIISGNHEKLFLKFIKSDQSFKKEITDKYGKCFNFYSETFPDHLYKKIKSLKDELVITINNINFLICHGSPKISERYIYPDENKSEIIDIDGIDFIFNGHTHYPMIYNGKNSTLINVGSVGQSRVAGGIANWGIFDTENSVYSPKSTIFDIEKVIINLHDHNEEKKYLFDILKRNNYNYE